MNFWADKRKRKIFIIILSIVLVLAIIVGACAIYVGDYYHIDGEAIIVLAESTVRNMTRTRPICPTTIPRLSLTAVAMLTSVCTENRTATAHR